jgi:hypothetical protein
VVERSKSSILYVHAAQEVEGSNIAISILFCQVEPKSWEKDWSPAIDEKKELERGLVEETRAFLCVGEHWLRDGNKDD